MYPQFCKYIYNTMKSGIHRCLRLSLFCLHFNGHFPGEPELASVYWSKGWWRWRWQLDYWSYKSRKAPVNSSPPTNQHPVFYRLDALPVAKPTASKHITRTCLPKLTWGLPTCLWPLIAPGYCDWPLYDDVFYPPLLHLELHKPFLLSQVGGGKTGNRLRWSIPL